MVGKFVMDNKEIIVKSELSLEDVHNVFNARLSESDKIDIVEITDIERQVKGEQNYDWIKREQFIDRSKVVQSDIDERIQAMSNILTEAIRIKNGGEPSKWRQIKSKIMKRVKNPR